MRNDVSDTVFKSSDTCDGMLQYICLYTHHCERIKEPLMRKNRTFTAASHTHTHTYPRVRSLVYTETSFFNHETKVTLFWRNFVKTYYL